MRKAQNVQQFYEPLIHTSYQCMRTVILKQQSREIQPRVTLLQLLIFGCRTISSTEVTAQIQIEDCSLMLRPMFFLQTVMNDIVNSGLQQFWRCKCNAHWFWVCVAVIYHAMNVLPYDVCCCLHNLLLLVQVIVPPVIEDPAIVLMGCEHGFLGTYTSRFQSALCNCT